MYLILETPPPMSHVSPYCNPKRIGCYLLLPWKRDKTYKSLSYLKAITGWKVYAELLKGCMYVSGRSNVLNMKDGKMLLSLLRRNLT